jgi:CRP/FNR family transcriptional regulator
MRPAVELGDRSYGLLLDRSTERAYARGCVIWTEGAITEGLFLFESGTVRLSRENDDGRNTTVGEESAPAAILTPGLFDGGPNCTTAKAVTDCGVHVVAHNRLVGLWHENPELLLTLACALSCRDRRTAVFIDLVTVATVRQRVARLLLDLMRQSRTRHLGLPHSQATLAQTLGTVREVLFRSLKQLQSEGVLRFRGAEIVIENEQALRAAAGNCHCIEPVFDGHATPPTPCYVALLLTRP